MLIAAGPGVYNLVDYTNFIDDPTIEIVQQKGDTLPSSKCIIHDAASSFPIQPEDDIVFLDDSDTNGWPTVNLLANPSFEGSYVSGIAPSWAGTNTGAAGVTVSSSASSKFGSAAQSLAISNVANSTTISIGQQITLPATVTGGPMLDLPYVFSVWLRVTGAFSGVAGCHIRTDFQNNGSTLFSVTQSIDTFLSATGNWQRITVIGTPPATSNQAYVYVRLITNSGTNSGTLLIDGAQLERETFARVQSSVYPAPVTNPTMVSAASATGVVDAWSKVTSSGATFSVATNPTISGTAQQIAISNISGSTSVGIQQSGITVNPGMQYQVQATYQITSALSTGVQALTATIAAYDANNSLLSTLPLFNQGATQVNQTFVTAFQFGYNTNASLPSTTATITLTIGLTSGSSGTNSGTIVIEQCVVVATNIGFQSGAATTTARAAGIYPTPYCDNQQAGCYTDNGASGAYFRQARFFGGFVRNTTYDYSQSPERYIDCDGTGYGVLLQEAPANLIIRAQSDVAAINQACTYAAGQGFLVGLDFTTYMSSVATVDAMTFNWQTTKDVLSKIADMNVADYWVDDYKFLHYQPALSGTAPFGLSDSPNKTTTFPFASWKFNADSTQSLTTKVFEGATILSLPQTNTFTGSVTTTTATYNSGTTYTSISVAALSHAIVAGTLCYIGTNETVTVATTANNGATSVSINSHRMSATHSSGSNFSAYGFLLNGGSAITQIDSATNGGTGQTVGILGINTFAQGYNALYDRDTGYIDFASTGPANGNSVVVTYRFSSPVIIRVKNGPAESSTGTIRRRISNHQADNTVASVQSATDRANAELSQFSKARPIGSLVIYFPPCPMHPMLHVGQAIRITHAASNLTAQLFQIQTTKLRYAGPGSLKMELGVGYYRPDFAIQMVHSRRELVSLATAAIFGSPISDVLDATDGWVVTDSAVAVVTNIGTWGNPTPSTWDGTYTWG